VLTLTTATNDFTGSVSASNSGANAMQLTDANAIQLGDRHHGEQPHGQCGGDHAERRRPHRHGDFDLNAGAGPITLTTAANNFTGAVSLNNSVRHNVAVTDANAIVLGPPGRNRYAHGERNRGEHDHADRSDHAGRERRAASFTTAAA
jgi:hypothetical protein